MRLRLASDEHLVASIRRGDASAFDAVYERHSGELLSFCGYMLGSRQDAEDAVQATFAAGYRALRTDKRPISLRPWLFTIARNECLSIIRKRRPTVELNGEPALHGDPFSEVELREQMRHLLDDLRELPEPQRTALLLVEVHGLSHSEAGRVLGARTEQVKAYLYQARSNLISERQAREADCRDIREELANARGAMLLRSRFRRHMRSCADCRTYADGLARQRRYLGALVPLIPTLALKYRALEDALGVGGADPATYAPGAAVGGSLAGTALELAGGGVKALAVKLAAGVAALGVGAGVSVSVLAGRIPEGPEAVVSAASKPAREPLVASTRGVVRPGSTVAGLVFLGENAPGERGGQPGAPTALEPSTQTGGAGEGDISVGAPGGAGSQPDETPAPPSSGAAPEGQGGGAPADVPKAERQRQHKHEEQEAERALRKHKRQAEAQPGREEREREREENQQEHEQIRHEREQRKTLGGAGAPPKDKEERVHAHEERLREHEERVKRREERRN
jgi:RNA polymerase sigma factor (sigma-70 family)